MSDLVLYPAFGSVQRIGVGLLRPWFARTGVDIRVGTLIPENLDGKLPFVLVRSDRRTGRESRTSRDERFLRTALLTVEVFTNGLNAEDDGYDIEESARLCLWDAWRRQVVVPDGGVISSIVASTDIARVSDYATSTGVVQYASLPKNTVRHEAVYQVMVRPPQSTENLFIPA